MKNFFANCLDVWEDLDWLERVGISIVGVVLLVVIVLFILFPPLLLGAILLILICGVIVLFMFGITTILDRI